MTKHKKTDIKKLYGDNLKNRSLLNKIIEKQQRQVNMTKRQSSL